MKQFSVAVNKIEDGILHVRSAGLIMKEASQFASDIKVTKDEKTVNGKDILEWMGLSLQLAMSSPLILRDRTKKLRPTALKYS